MAASRAKQGKGQIARIAPLRKLHAYFRTLGPGLITGASDDDPSGIGTYAQTGAQFGYLQLWTAIATFPLQVAVQEMCARIGLQAGAGLAEVIRKHYPKPVLYFCVALLLVANTINLGADLGAMAEAGQLLVGIPFGFWLVGLTLGSICLEVFLDYKCYARVLRILTLALLAYVVVVFVVPQDWGKALAGTFIPVLSIDKGYLLNLVAVLGTTISPYLFFWQASEEVEEEIEEGRITTRSRRGVSKAELKWMRTDVVSGMFFSNAVMWSIILTGASTLFAKGVHQVDTAVQAAQMLRPVAGDLAYALFAAGILGTGLLAIPILAGSAAYAVAETIKFREGLYLTLSQARRFYGVIVLSTIVGAVLNFAGVNPIQALYYTAVLNGLVAPPILFIIMLVANDRSIMEGRTNGRVSNVLGWVTTIAMTVAALALLATLAADKFVRS
jgi:NRAMP (natural resistance-associated macrophage protein)-like metal ion transporter